MNATTVPHHDAVSKETNPNMVDDSTTTTEQHATNVPHHDAPSKKTNPNMVDESTVTTEQQVTNVPHHDAVSKETNRNTVDDSTATTEQQEDASLCSLSDTESDLSTTEQQAPENTDTSIPVTCDEMQDSGDAVDSSEAEQEDEEKKAGNSEPEKTDRAIFADLNSDNTTPPTDTESSSTAVDGSGDAELEDITEKTVEEPDDAELEESPKATVEESGDTELEDITETTVEEPNDAELEESTETAVEESDDAEVEESTETATKEPNDAELEESTETAVEKSDVTELEDSIESPTELSEENAKISLAALIVNAQEKSDEQETTTHQELERLLVKVAAKDEELAASNVNIAELQKKLSQAETSAAEKTRDAKADQTSQLNDKLDELASAQIKLVEQLAVANKMASTSSGATQKTVQEEVAKAKIKSFVKKLENRVKTLEGAEEQVKLLRGSLKNLEAKNMEFGAEKEALTKQLEQAAKKIMKSTDMKAELDAATEDYQDSKYQLRELEATLDGMELRQEQTSARARTHQEHRSILASKVRDLEGEIERLTKRLHDMEEDSLRQTPVVAEKKSKKRKPMKKKQSVSSPETDQSFDLDKYLSTVKPDRYVQQLKMVKAAVIAVLAVICASLFGCGTFPADAVMSGSLVCKPTYNTVAWLAGTGGTAELKKARREAEELKTENARLNYLRIEHQRKFIDLEKSVKKERKDIFTEVVGFKKDRDLMDDIWEEEYEGDLRKLEKTIKELQEAQDLACADQAKSENEVEKLPANLDSPLQQ